MKNFLILMALSLVLFSCGTIEDKNSEIIKESKASVEARILKPIKRISLDKLPTELTFHKTTNSIALTFDAGASDRAFVSIMDILKKHKLRITVFVTGEFASKFPQHIKRLIQDGHEIGNHSYSHPYFTQISDQEIKDEILKTEETLNSLGAANPRPLFRYPYGSRNHHTHELIQELGYKSIMWSLDTIDWRDGAPEIKNRLYKAKAGDIILAHLGDVETAKVLDEVLKHYKKNNLKVLSISELLSN